jgi:cold shock CspA family protein
VTDASWGMPRDLIPDVREVVIGDVVEFDEARGLGSVEFGDGRLLPFHCTAITDGSRRITPGTVVAFEVVAGRLGRLEARSIRPLPGVMPGATLGQVVREAWEEELAEFDDAPVGAGADAPHSMGEPGVAEGGGWPVGPADATPPSGTPRVEPSPERVPESSESAEAGTPSPSPPEPGAPEALPGLAPDPFEGFESTAWSESSSSSS